MIMDYNLSIEHEKHCALILGIHKDRKFSWVKDYANKISLEVGLNRFSICCRDSIHVGSFSVCLRGEVRQYIADDAGNK